LTVDGVDLIGIGRPLCGQTDASAQVLAGAAAMPRYEDEVQFGPGPFSQSSRWQFFKKFNTLASQSWYYQNLVRLGEDRPLLRPGQLLRAALGYSRRDAALAKAIRARDD
jgi:hypothetical protein